MAGLFDLHMLLAAKRGWTALSKDKTAFKELYVGVSDTVVTEWYDALFPNGSDAAVEFRPAFVPEQTSLPCVIVQYADEPEDVAPMDYWGGTLGQYTPNEDPNLPDVLTGYQRRHHAVLLRQIAIFNVIAPHPELLRALHLAVLFSCFTTRKGLHDLGYIDLEYLGGSDVSIEQGLMPNELGAFMRTQRWRARSHLEISETLAPVDGEILIASSDITVDGYPGGIKGDT